MDERIFETLVKELIYDSLTEMMELGEMPNALFEPSTLFKSKPNASKKKKPIKRKFFPDHQIIPPKPQIFVEPPPILVTSKASFDDDFLSKKKSKSNYYKSLPFLYYDLVSPPSSINNKIYVYESMSNVKDDHIQSVNIASSKLSDAEKKDMLLQLVEPKSKEKAVPSLTNAEKKDMLLQLEPGTSKKSKNSDLELKVIMTEDGPKSNSTNKKLNSKLPLDSKSDFQTPAIIIQKNEISQDPEQQNQINQEINQEIAVMDKKPRRQDPEDDHPLSQIDDNEEDVETVEKILQEKKYQTLQDFVKHNKGNFVKDDDIVVRNEKSMNGLTRLFRILNFIRALVTTAYGIYVVLVVANKDDNSIVQASPNRKTFYYVSCFFLCLDLLITVIKAFPRVFMFWKKANWDFFTRSFSIWQLVLDLELILDISPLVANICLKIYSYRFNEVLISKSSPAAVINVKNILGEDMMEQVNLITRNQTFNLSLLVVFAASTFFMVFFHLIRIYKALIRRGAFSLANLCVVKSSLLLFDLATNGFLLYTVLATKGEDIFSNNLLTILTLIIVATSMFVTLSTNVLVNFPLHYTFLRMLLKTRVPHTLRKTLSSKRILSAAAKKTFHPIVICIFGLASCFNVGALGYVLVKTRNFDLNTLIDVSINLGQSNILYAALWLNLVANYLCGVVALILYIIWLPMKAIAS